jgi:hypothetical protein
VLPLNESLCILTLPLDFYPLPPAQHEVSPPGSVYGIRKTDWDFATV